MNRTEVVAAVLTALQTNLDGVERMAKLASDEATSSETKSEGKYDTRATEASYLARGQAERVGALRRLVMWVQALVYNSTGTIRLGSLVQMAEKERCQWVLILPDGGGVRVSTNTGDVRVITPHSPIGAALMGAEEDDEVELQNSERTLEILRIL